MSWLATHPSALSSCRCCSTYPPKRPRLKSVEPTAVFQRCAAIHARPGLYKYRGSLLYSFR
jgi:hypothetical protein